MNQRFSTDLHSLTQPLKTEIAGSSGISAHGSDPPTLSEGSAHESAWHYIFQGPNGLRAGWRLLIFSAIVGTPIAGLLLAERVFMPPGAHKPSVITPALTMAGDGILFVLFLFASFIMTLIEGRTIGDYGLPARRAFNKQFWQGAIIGFVAMSALLGMLHAAGVFNFGSLALHGAALVKYAALWGAAFLVVGLTEEFVFRGYAQFTLTTGVGFWPTAILLSFGFGAIHLGNHGENWIGALDAGSAGFLFCFILRRTGDLWMPIGVHAAWDWAESFFYGVPDSGTVSPGHMLSPSFHGSKLLTGGSVGPEGSILCFVVLALLIVFFHFWLSQARYPNPEALGTRPHAQRAM